MSTTFRLILAFALALWFIAVGLGNMFVDPDTQAGQVFQALGNWTLGVMVVLGLLTGGGFALVGEAARVEASRSTDAAILTGLGLLGSKAMEVTKE